METRISEESKVAAELERGEAASGKAALTPISCDRSSGKNSTSPSLSVIIPSHAEIYLQQTINSLLSNAEGSVEIIVILDGYWPKEFDWTDKRIKVVHLGKNRGMRDAINAGVSVARGEFIARTDEHCMFGPGWDRILTAVCEDNWIVVPRRYALDPVKWEIMPEIPAVDFSKLVIQGDPPKFSAQNWKERDEEMKDVVIGETLGMQGSFWLMKKSWWDKVIVKLQTKGYGPLIQDSHEMHFKTLKAGGKMMLNKGTWYAHKERRFPRTHNSGTKENPANCEKGYAYCLSVWKDYYENELRPRWGI